MNINDFSLKVGPWAALLLTAGLLAACDTVEQPLKPQVTSSLTTREQGTLDSLESKQAAPGNVQRVLIEDFTGQYCGNCPSAARKADSLERAHPDQVLVMEVHATEFYSKPRLPDFPIDFRVTGASDDVSHAYDLDNRGLPQGAVNRAPIPGANNEVVGTYALWPAAVTAALAHAPEQDLRLTSQYDPTTRTVRLKIVSRYLTAQSDAYRLGIAVTEDSLLSTQKDYRAPAGTVQMPGQETPNYPHHNVLRAVLAGTFGSRQVDKPFASQQFNNYLSYKLPNTWEARHCRVIAYLAREVTGPIAQTTGQIVQAAEVRIAK